MTRALTLLGIESSCDDTAAAVVCGTTVLSSVVYGQTSLHADFGGVVPEIAARAHAEKLDHCIEEALGNAGKTLRDLDGIAVTAGPGLIGGVLSGVMCAKGLSAATGLPLIGVNHHEGHLHSVFMKEDAPLEEDVFPMLGLLVSGGDSSLVLMRGTGRYELLGSTIDDAAGEAFDKVAKMLELPYPGGPQVARLALDGDSSRFRFPRPMTDRPGLDFSFSGLKTYTMNTLRDITNPTIQDKSDIALAFQTAVVDTIRIKCQRAIQQTGLSRLVLAGGVSANLALRDRLKVLGSKHHVEIYYPELKLCTDNGAMIAYAGLQRLRQNHTEDLSITVRPRWPMTELN